MDNNVYKIDLHTHSILSHDGGISKKQYLQLLQNKTLDFIAITDHNQIGFAKALHNELGHRIIVGEEIKTLDGEIIGLYLDEKIDPGQSAIDTIKLIREQHGIVYIPHPFESQRSSIKYKKLEEIQDKIDIVEVFNGRGIFRGKPYQAMKFSAEHKLAGASSSDAHCRMGIGKTYSTIGSIPDKKNLVQLLSKSVLEKSKAPLISLFCPMFNRIKNQLFLSR